MRLEWIEDILATIDTGSITSAAKKRFLTQSAFTRRIRTIEDFLGCPLFDRSKKPIKLLPHVKDQENEMRDLASRMAALKTLLALQNTSSNNQISIACQHTIATTLSPSLIHRLTSAHDINVKISEGNRDICLMKLLTSEVDFALIYESIDEGAIKDKGIFIEQHLGSDWMIPVVANSYKAPIDADLKRNILPVISYPRDTFLGQLFERSFMMKLAPNFQINSKAETELTLAALHYTIEGIGIGWVPRSIAAPYLENDQLKDLSHKFPKQELRAKIIRLKDKNTPLAEKIWQEICA